VDWSTREVTNDIAALISEETAYSARGCVPGKQPGREPAVRHLALTGARHVPGYRYSPNGGYRIVPTTT